MFEYRWRIDWRVEVINAQRRNLDPLRDSTFRGVLALANALVFRPPTSSYSACRFSFRFASFFLKCFLFAVIAQCTRRRPTIARSAHTRCATYARHRTGIWHCHRTRYPPPILCLFFHIYRQQYTKSTMIRTVNCSEQKMQLSVLLDATPHSSQPALPLSASSNRDASSTSLFLVLLSLSCVLNSYIGVWLN